MDIRRRSDGGLKLLICRELAIWQRFVAHAGEHDIERQEATFVSGPDAMSGAQFTLDSHQVPRSGQAPSGFRRAGLTTPHFLTPTQIGKSIFFPRSMD
jgi:hypothetical protein